MIQNVTSNLYEYYTFLYQSKTKIFTFNMVVSSIVYVETGSELSGATMLVLSFALYYGIRGFCYHAWWIVAGWYKDFELGLPCKECGATTKKVLKDITIRINGEVIIIKNFPVMTCPDCGEEFYYKPFVDKIRKDYRPGKKLYTLTKGNKRHVP